MIITICFNGKFSSDAWQVGILVSLMFVFDQSHLGFCLLHRLFCKRKFAIVCLLLPPFHSFSWSTSLIKRHQGLFANWASLPHSNYTMNQWSSSKNRLSRSNHHRNHCLDDFKWLLPAQLQVTCHGIGADGGRGGVLAWDSFAPIPLAFFGSILSLWSRWIFWVIWHILAPCVLKRLSLTQDAKNNRCTDILRFLATIFIVAMWLQITCLLHPSVLYSPGSSPNPAASPNHCKMIFLVMGKYFANHIHGYSRIN